MIVKSERSHSDVVIMGGGPAGAVSAAVIARAGARVTVLERESFPRFHLGESLSPGAVATLEDLGLVSALTARYLPRRGTRLGCCRTGRTQRFGYDEAPGEGRLEGFQAPRADFDDLLLHRARELGAEVKERCTAVDVSIENNRVTGVFARHDDGHREHFTANMVIDATGQDSLLATRMGSRVSLPGLDRTALVAHYQHATRDMGDTEGDLELVVSPHGHVWSAPLKGEVNTLGAVCSPVWMRARNTRESLEDFFDRTLDDAPLARARLTRAARFTPVQSVSDFAFMALQRHGPGWLAVGDAGGFVDPLFCSGTLMAIAGGAKGAMAVLDALAHNDPCDDALGRFATEIEAALELLIGLTQALYLGDLGDVMVEARTRAQRAPFAGVLAGDVFGEDPPWRAGLRAEFSPKND